MKTLNILLIISVIALISVLVVCMRLVFVFSEIDKDDYTGQRSYTIEELSKMGKFE